MSEPHCLHLLVAHDALTKEYWYGIYVTLCGNLLGASELPSATCPDDCGAEIVYCPGCLRAANERNYDAGVDVDCPPTVIVTPVSSSRRTQIDLSGWRSGRSCGGAGLLPVREVRSR